MPVIEMTPVAVVRNDVQQAVEANWGKVISEIHVDAELAAGLQGLEDWSHVIVLFLMHESDYQPAQHLVSRPVKRDDMPEIGVFAQRSRNRPNRIGISAVRVLGIEGNILRVKGLDAIDGTPVLDIKPYAPVYDGANNPLVPEWFVRLMQRYF